MSMEGVRQNCKFSAVHACVRGDVPANMYRIRAVTTRVSLWPALGMKQLRGTCVQSQNRLSAKQHRLHEAQGGASNTCTLAATS